MNKKGYTLVEILAVIAIMGILAGVATIAVSRYLSSTKEKAYEALATSTLEAAENYIADNDEKADNTYNISELISGNYLDEATDPGKKESSCDGYVKYNEDESTIYLLCPSSKRKYTYKNGNLSKPTEIVNSNTE